MMLLSENEIKAMHAEIQNVSSTKMLLARPALQAMLDLVSPSFSISPVELLQQYLARIKAAERLITPCDTIIPQIVQIFGLIYDILSTDATWTLVEDSILKEPKILRQNLSDLRDAYHEEQSATTCRIAIELILIQCRRYVRHKYNLARAETASLITPSTPPKDALNVSTEAPKKCIKLYPESIITVEVPNRSVPNGVFLVSGRVDWAMGYDLNDEDGALLVAVETKSRSNFSAGESQLIAYLAILRENRRRAGKTNVITQGFYSDGNRFGFVYIRDNGVIVQSPTRDTHARGGLSMVFSFIVAMLETAHKDAPIATSTKPGIPQNN